ncbi:MAG: hypothetical protein EXQ69_06325 [Acidimicrobiia bacterium]|nr:hypothetical protein [Acidimicrobiia bacterium]
MNTEQLRSKLSVKPDWDFSAPDPNPDQSGTWAVIAQREYPLEGGPLQEDEQTDVATFLGAAATTFRSAAEALL